MMMQESKSITVKNRRLKMSPGGIVTLPVSARKALKMEKGKGTRVTVAVKDNVVTLAPINKNGGFRVSSKGQLELRGEARAVLATGTNRYYWIEANDESRVVTLNPFK